MPIGTWPDRGLHPQIVDLVEAAAVGREAHQDVDRLVAVDRPVFGRLEAVGDELHRAADGVDAGAVFRGLRLVDLDLPVDAGQRLAVVEIADVAARRQDGRDLLGGGRQHGRIERAELHLDRLAGRRAGARRRHLDQDAGNVGGLGADGVHDLVRRRSHAPVGELELDDADRVLGQLAHAARLLADAGVDGLEAVEREHALLDLGDQAVLLVEREVAAGMHDHLAVVGLDAGEELDAAAELAVGHLHRDQQQRRQRQRHAGVAQREPHGAHIGPAVARAARRAAPARPCRAARRASA